MVRAMGGTAGRSNIFICYRRDDTAGHAGRLFDRLGTRFGADRIFIDVDKIGPGVDFIRKIEEAVLETSRSKRFRAFGRRGGWSATRWLRRRAWWTVETAGGSTPAR
jgi:hypothetical protein